jgi:outer membrane protein insertion porin family
MRKTYPSTNSGLSGRILGIGVVLVFVFAGLVCAAEESAVLPVTQGEQPATSLPISSITVTGNRNITSSEVLSKVRSRAGQMFEAAKAAEDAKRVAELSGVAYCYYSVNIVNDKVELTFAVVEKNVVGSITFEGNCAYKAKKLASKLTFKVGEYLDPVMASVGVRTLTEFYKNEGFAFAKVELDSSGLSSGKVVYKIEEGPRVKVVSVRFEGNSALSSGELKKLLKTKTRKWLILQGYYNEDAVEQDVIKLQEAYQNQSYLDARITAKKEFNAKKNKVRVIYEIEEGPAYCIDKIRLDGAKQFPQEQIRAVIKSEECTRYNISVAQMDAKRVTKLYREKGFVDVKVEQKRIFVAKDKVDLQFDITEGGQFRIGQIEITGNEQTQDHVFRRVLDEYEFQPGKWYNANMARGDGQGELERRVQRMTVAESVTITPTGNKPDRKDAQVHVIEGQTGMIMLGAGVSSDSGVIGQFVFNQQNFDISNRPKSLKDFFTGDAFKGGGQNLRIALQPGTEVSEYTVSFTEPYLNDRPTQFDVTGSSWTRFQESYKEGRLMGSVGLEKRYLNRWRRSVSFRTENVSITDIDDDAPKEIKDVSGDNFLTGPRFGVKRDCTDDMYSPGKGDIFDVGYEQLTGDFTFGLLSATYKWYTTLHVDLAEQRTIFSTRIRAGTTVGSAPPFEKYYAGGENSIRGFEYRGVSTRGLETNVPNPERKDPIGSDWIFLANAEVTTPIVGEKFAGLFFIDSGTIDSGPYRVSVGTGVQIQMPQWFGPVPMRFELGFPLLKSSEDDTQIFSFSVGRLF